jgi:microcystin-dependent protein
MSDQDGSRVTGDDALGRQIKTNLTGLDSFIPPAPPFGGIESPTLRPLELRGKSAVRPRLNLGATTGLLAAALVVVVVLGSGVWRPSHSAGADESPTASEVASSAASTTGVSEASLDATAGLTNTPELSPSAVASSGGSQATVASPWYASEVYFLSLMNCTRTGGWVTVDGACGRDTLQQHTLPAQPALVLDPDISAKVARPYAKYLADNDLLTHNLFGTTPQSRLCSAGFCGSVWGENLASPGSSGQGGMVTVEIFYQNESFCGCQHYDNLMNPHYTRVGIGVWETSGHVRLVIDFAG